MLQESDGVAVGMWTTWHSGLYTCTGVGVAIEIVRIIQPLTPMIGGLGNAMQPSTEIREKMRKGKRVTIRTIRHGIVPFNTCRL